MKIGIISAMEAELAPLLANCKVSSTATAYGTTFYTGTIFDKDVVLCQCSIATVNAALCTSVMIRELGAQVIINTGIAGATGKGMKILDIVISNEVAFHDRDNNIMAKYYPFSNSFTADEKMVALAQKAASTVTLHDKPLTVYTGRIATGDLFVEDAALKKSIIESTNPLCVEMEGAAIGMTAKNNGVPFVVVRAMSDCADDEADTTYNTWFDDACNTSANITLAMLKEEF